MRFVLGLVCAVALAWLSVGHALAEDRPIDRDWRTGASVAPGAMTWTGDNIANKKQLIDNVARAQGKTCSDRYAFLGWGIGHGGPPAIMAKTREGYENAGYAITQKPGSIDTEIVWIARGAEREAVILWGAFGGSTVYFSCLTAGAAAADPSKSLYLGVLTLLGLGSLILGLWMCYRVRAHGQTSPLEPGAARTSVLGLVMAITGAVLLAVTLVVALLA